MDTRTIEIFFSRQARRTRRLSEWPRVALLASRARRRLRQARRLIRWQLEETFVAPEIYSGEALPHVHFVAERALENCQGDPALERGKARNVELACVALDGRQLRRGEIFSFWRTVGRPSLQRGYERGSEVRAGCIVPTVGGGLCLISNALFEAAVVLGWTIHERAGHTMSVGNNLALDATVAWPDVDLRVAPDVDAVLRCRVEDRAAGAFLVLTITSAAPSPARWTVEQEQRSGTVIAARDLFRRSPDGTREHLGQDRKRVASEQVFRTNCYTCDEHACHARPSGL